LLRKVRLFIFTPTYASPLKGEEFVRGAASPLKGEESIRSVSSLLKREEAVRGVAFLLKGRKCLRKGQQGEVKRSGVIMVYSCCGRSLDEWLCHSRDDRRKADEKDCF